MSEGATSERLEAAPPGTREIEVVLSDRAEEVDEAISIVHDGFVEAGFASPNGSGRRLHPAYLNPGTVFALARIGDETIGTAALIADGPFGLPSDRAFAEENDALREESPLPLREVGSLSVRSEWRRHTRRVFVRAISALTRVALAEYPDAIVPMAIAPQTERFYAAMVGARLVAGPRPLYGAPALLLRTSARELTDHTRAQAGSGPRTMDRLITEPDPSWLHDLRTGEPFEMEWLRDLLAELGVMSGVESQVRMLAQRHPQVLAEILRRHGSRTAS